jgi:hypothetical protein
MPSADAVRNLAWTMDGLADRWRFIWACSSLRGAFTPIDLRVASPFVVFERDEVSSVAGSPPFDEASGTATAGAKRPT